jgi:hypothetical protein
MGDTLNPVTDHAQYNATPPTATDGKLIALQADVNGNLKVTGGGTAGSPSGGVQTTQRPEDGASLTKSSVTMTGASASLVAASSSRLIVIVANASGNALAVIDPTGGTASATSGIPLAGGEKLEIVGKAAQSAMTQIGTNTQILTVYTG